MTSSIESGTCIRITADNVTLDGQGYSIRNTASNVLSEAINVSGVSNVTLRNLTVAGWRDGVAVYGSENVTIEGSTLRENEYASVRAVSSVHVDAVDVVFNATGNYDGELFYKGVSGGLIADNRFVNGDKAVRAVGSFGLRVEDNEFTGNTNGIWFENTDESRIANNRMTGNGGGIKLIGYAYEGDSNGASGNLVVNNTIRDNGGGIVIRDAQANVIRNNTVTNNFRSGIELSGTDFSSTDVADVRILDNDVSDNSKGITLTGYHAARYAENPTAVRNVTLSNNTVLGNEDQGITLFSTARVTMRNNTIAGGRQSLLVGEYDVYEGSLDQMRTKENYYHDIDTSNTIDGKPIYYLRNVSDRVIEPPDDPAFVGIVDGSNVTVRDLSFSNVSHGVLLVDTPDSRVENVTTDRVTYGVFLTQGSNGSDVVGNDLDTGVSHRAEFNPRGVSVISTSGVLVANNTITEPGSVSAGIELTSGASRNRIANNTVRNQLRGILIGALGTSSVDAHVDNNTIVDNRLLGNEWGIDDDSYDASGNWIARNAIDSATKIGIDVERGDRYDVVDNVVTDSAQGISAFGNSTIRNNRVRDSVGTGILANDGAKVLNNTVLSGDRHGIRATGTNNVVRNNTVLDTPIGIEVSGAGTLAADNVVYNSSGLGGRAAGIRYEGYDTSTIRNNTVESSNWGILVEDGREGTFERNAIGNTTIGILLMGDSVNNSFAGETVLNGGKWAFEERGGEYTEPVGTTATNITADSTVWRVDAPVNASFAVDDAAFDVAPRTVCDPAGYTNAGIFLHATNTTPGGWLNLTIDYPAGAVDPANESTLALWRYNGTWSEVPGSTVDTAADAVSANVTAFDYEVFALLAEGTATCPTLAPNVSVSRTGDVGTVFPGETATTTVVVENVGFAPLAVNNTTITGADAGAFTLSNGGSFILDPDETRNLTVTFAPPATGTYAATLNVTSNDTAAEEVSVEVSGASSVVRNATAVDLADGNGAVGHRDSVEVSIEVVGGSAELGSAIANATAFGWGNLTLTDGDDDGTYNGTFTVYEFDAVAFEQGIPVLATDAGGNTNRTLTNSIVLDTTPPRIVNATASDASDGDGNVTTGDTVALSANVSDVGAGVEAVTANASAFGAGNVTLSEGDGQYTATVTVNASEAATLGSHTVGIAALDAVGNTNATDTNPLTLTTPTTATTTPTATPTATSTATATETATGTEETVSTSTPGFGIGVAVVALLLFLAAAARRP